MLELSLVSYTGETVYIHGPRIGHSGIALLTDPEGLWEAPINAVWMQGAFQEGATYLGYRTEPIDVVLPLAAKGEDYRTWKRNDDTLHRILGNPDTGFTLTAYSPSGTRKLHLRLTSAPKCATKIDPGVTLVSQYVVQARAGWPRWVGKEETSVVSFTSSTGEGTVTVSNPTDTACWPRWVCQAPGKWTLPDYSFTEGPQATRTITTPTLGEGEHLTVDTYPTHEPYVAANGSNIAGRFAGVLFLHPIPPHTPPTPVPVSLTGGPAEGAQCMIVMPRHWRRPYGGER